MYNLYIAEKNQKLKEEKIKVERIENKLKENRKKMLPNLVSRYQARVENFVFDMSHSPIIVKDSTHIVKNPRQELFDEEIDKIRGRKGIILKGYKTEKMRIEEHLRNINFYYPKKEENSKEGPNFTKRGDKLNISSNGVTIKQPEMRFKPRTDLERIFDEINKNSFRKLDRNIIEKQLKTLEMNSTKKFNNQNQVNIYNQDKDDIPDYKDAAGFISDYINHEDFDHLALEKDKTGETKAEKENKIKLENSRKLELNSQAKNLMKEFHNKTHFKGVTSMINFKNQTYSPERKREHNRTTLFLNNNNNTSIFEDLSDEDGFGHQKNLSDKGFNRRSDFRLNYNPYNLKKSEDFTCDKKQLTFLKKLALEDNIHKITDKSTNNDNPRYMINNYNEKSNEYEEKKFDSNTERLVIDNQPFNLSQINDIAYKVLNKCNVARTKNKNNNRMLKAGEGKLMMTNGISISEFIRKFKL